MTYYGAEKVIAGYNVMGVARRRLKPALVISPMTRPTEHSCQRDQRRPHSNRYPRVASQNFSSMLKYAADMRPCSARGTARVGNTALFLCSSLASAITGEVIHVDVGTNINGHLVAYRLQFCI